MDPDDPFFSADNNDRTVLRPIPGGRKEDIKRPQQPTSVYADAGMESLGLLGNLNPLEKAASGLLALLTQLNQLPQHPDPAGLKQNIMLEIKQFQQQAQATGIDQETVFTARYVLCTVLDEAVLNTPWGQESGWAQQSLLSHFHKEVSGGERFFQLLKSLGSNPTHNRDLLELMYLCLSFGFEGRYRLNPDGKDKLMRIREWLFNLIQTQRGQPEASLSPHWRGVTDQRNPLLRLIPLWVMAAVAAGILVMAFALISLLLNKQSDRAYQQIVALKAPEIAAPVQPPAPPIVEDPPAPTLAELLVNEINANLLAVRETDDMSLTTIQGDGLFKSGSASIQSSVIPLIYRITGALNEFSGHVLITGHTDSIPIRGNLKYPSNWALSQARAESVAELVQHKLDDPDRLLIEGRGDSEPIATNKDRAGRARNRRVEIILMR